MPSEESSSTKTSSLLLLDTHCWVWMEFGLDHEFSKAGLAAIQEARAEARLLVSAISVWEVALLDAKRRLELYMPCDEWVRRALAAPGLELAPLTPDNAVECNRLPGDLHADLVDRILAATARRLGATLLTRDDKLLEYGREGHALIRPA